MGLTKSNLSCMWRNGSHPWAQFTRLLSQALIIVSPSCSISRINVSNHNSIDSNSQSPDSHIRPTEWDATGRDYANPSSRRNNSCPSLYLSNRWPVLIFVNSSWIPSESYNIYAIRQAGVKLMRFERSRVTRQDEDEIMRIHPAATTTIHARHLTSQIDCQFWFSRPESNPIWILQYLCDETSWG